MAITILLFALCILSSGFTGNIYKKLSANSHSAAASMTMPAVWFAMLTVLFGIPSLLAGKLPEVRSVIAAVCAGLGIAAAASILIESMKRVSLSISIIIMNLNFILPVLLSALFLRESAGCVQMLGMVLAVAVIVLLNLAPAERGGKQGGNPLRYAVLLPLIASIANGMTNFCITLNTRLAAPEMPFYAVMYGSGALFCLLFGIILHKREQARTFPLSAATLKTTLPYLALMGVCNGVCFYTMGLLNARINPAALFTTVTCASILLSIVVGVLFQGEKITKKTLISLLFCVIAILCQHSGLG